MATKKTTQANGKLVGTDSADVLEIRHASNTVLAQGGADKITVYAGGGHKIFGRYGGDTVTITAGAGDGITVYGDVPDDIPGSAGSMIDSRDTVNVSGGSSHKIYGGAAADTITLQTTVGNGNYVYGGSGADNITVYGGKQHKIYGDQGPDTIILGSELNAYEQKNGVKSEVSVDAGTGQDSITVKGGNGHSIAGGAGPDTITVASTAGNNMKIDGGSGEDTIVISGGTGHTIAGGQARDTITINSGSGYTVDGGSAVDTITLENVTDSKVAGGSEKDFITVNGGSGVNSYGGSGDDVITVNGGDRHKVYGEIGNDVIRVTGTNIQAYGGAGDDKLYGGDGNDYLDGGTGNDTLTGGAGQDTFVYANGEGNDTIKDYEEGQDTLKISSGSVSGTTLSGDNVFLTVGNGSVTVENGSDKAISLKDSRGSYTASGTTIKLGYDFQGEMDANAYLSTITSIDGRNAKGVVNITGNARNNVIYAAQDGGTINGGAGNDILYGGTGKNTLNGDAGQDYLSVEGDNNNLYGGTGNDTLEVTGNNNLLYGGAGNDTLEVAGGIDNYLSGDEGNDSYIVNWPLRGEPNSEDECHNVTIDNTSAGASDIETLVINGAVSSSFRFYLSSGDENDLVIQDSASGDYIVIYDWANHGFESVSFDDKSFTNDEIYDILANSNRTQIDWNLGDTVTLAASEIGTGLQINGYKANDFVVTLNSEGQLVMTDAERGTLIISNWSENTLETVTFEAGGNEQSFTAEEFAGGIFTTLALSNEDGQELVYNSGSDVRQEFDIDFTTSTNIRIISTSGVEDRIRFTNGFSVNNLNLSIRENDLVLGYWDTETNQVIDGQVVIEDYRNSTVKTVEFGDITYHLVTGETNHYVSSDTFKDRYLFLDRAKNMDNDKDQADWSVTFENLSGRDSLDLRFLPGNSRYYALSGTVDGQDMVLTHRYTEYNAEGVQETETLGTIRLKDFFNTDGTVNSENGYPMIRVRRDFYAGTESPEAFDSWVWNQINGQSPIDERNYRWLHLNAGTADADEINLGELVKQNEKHPWLYYAGDGNDTVTAQAGDIVYGDAGDDTLYAKGRMSDVQGGLGNDTIVVRGADGENLDHVVVRGGSDNDVITAYGSYLYLNGGSGDDEIHIRSAAGADVISAYNAVNGSYGEDRIYIHAGHDTRVNGGKDNDTIYAYLGDNHVLNGGAGDDEIHIVDDGTKRSNNNRGIGRDGNDSLYIENGGEGHLLRGDAGDDYLSVDGNNNTLYGGTGNDTLEVVGGLDNYLAGDEGNDSYIVNWPLRDEANGANECYNVTIDNASAGESDMDTLVIKGADSSSFNFYLSSRDENDLVIQDNVSGDYIVVYDWANHGFESVAFDDKIFTNDEIGEMLAGINYTEIIIDESGTYEAGQGNNIFTFEGTGWAAVISGATSKDKLDFSHYSDGEYGIANQSRQDNDLQFSYYKYGQNQDEEELVGSVTIKDYFVSEDKTNRIIIYNLNEAASKEYCLRAGWESGQENELTLVIQDTAATSGLAGKVIVYGTPGNDNLYGNEDNDYLYGNAGDDFLYGNAGNDTIYGGAGNDTLYSDAGDDILYGNAGNDEIYGDYGNDEIYGGADNDYLYGEEGNDILYGGDGDDRIEGGKGDDLITGGAGSDKFRYSVSYDESLTDDWGDVYIKHYEGDGNDIITDYSNEDTIVLSRSGTVDQVELINDEDVRLMAGDGSLTLQNAVGSIINILSTDDSSYHETIIYAGNGDDTLYGNEGDDILYGGGGNDEIYGGEGNNTINGGTGNDTFFYGYYPGAGLCNDIIKDYTENEDVLRICDDEITFADLSNDDVVFSNYSGQHITLEGAAEKAIAIFNENTYETSSGYGKGSYTVSRSEIVLGEDYGGTIDANNYFSTVQRLDGSKATENLIIKGNIQDNIIYFGNGNNTYVYRGGNDTVYSYGNGTNIIDLTENQTVQHVRNVISGNDILMELSNDCVITIKDAVGKDFSYSFYDNWTLSNAKLIVSVEGSADDDIINLHNYDFVENGHTIYFAYGNDGNDTIHGASMTGGKNYIYGGAGDDMLYGTEGSASFLYGEEGNDYIDTTYSATAFGGNGDDILLASNGSILYGEAGSDSFLLGSEYSSDSQIKDYTEGEDYLELSDSDYCIDKTEDGDVVVTETSLSVFGDRVMGTLEDAAGKVIHVKNPQGSYTISDTEVVLGNAFSGFIGADHYLPSITTINASAAENVVHISGNAKDNIIYASQNGGNLYGGDGNDTIYVGSGDRYLYGYGLESGDGISDNCIDAFVFGEDSTGSYTFWYYEVGYDILRFNNDISIASNSVNANSVLLELTNGGRINIDNAAGQEITFDFGDGNTTTRIFS